MNRIALCVVLALVLTVLAGCKPELPKGDNYKVTAVTPAPGPPVVRAYHAHMDGEEVSGWAEYKSAAYEICREYPMCFTHWYQSKSPTMEEAVANRTSTPEGYKVIARIVIAKGELQMAIVDCNYFNVKEQAEESEQSSVFCKSE